MTAIDEVEPGAFFNGARDYHEAAKRVMAADDAPNDPIIFLYAHAIELALKAYLRTQGMTCRDLAKPHLGHHLSNLYAEAAGFGLDNELNDQDARNITGMLQDSNEGQGLRYFNLKPFHLPTTTWLAEFAASLLTAVEPHVEKANPGFKFPGAAVKIGFIASGPKNSA